MRTFCGAVRVALSTGALWCVLAVSAAAWAEGTNAGDVVVLKDGGLVRGTIAEKMPDEYVVIVTIAGDQKRFEMSEVEYAGPANEAPGAQSDARPEEPPAPEALASESPAGKVAVEFESPDEEVEFHIRVGSAKATVQVPGALTGTADIEIDSFEALCEAPCARDLEPGRYAFGLSQGEDQAIKASGAVTIEGPATVRGDYHSYSGLRAAGWIVMFGGAALGTIMVLTSPNDCDALDPTCERFNPALLYGGLGVVVVSGFGGWAMISKDDEAEVRLVGGATRSPLLSRSHQPRSIQTADLVPTVGLAGAF